jgi:hypothetical protein
LAVAIEDGELQDRLDNVNINSVAFILTGATGPRGVGSTGGGDDAGLSSGGVAGIAIGAVSAFLLVGVAIAMFARREREDKADRNALAPAPLSLALDDEEATRGSSTVLGATTPNYGKKKSKPTVEMIMEKEKDMEATSDLAHGHGDDSSNAGSSGWSSSAGISSLNTGSNDGLEDPIVNIATGGATLASMAGVTAVRRASESEKSDTPSNSSMSRTDLDNAIEAGDWAAVGKSILCMTQTCLFKLNASTHFFFFLPTRRCHCRFARCGIRFAIHI